MQWHTYVKYVFISGSMAGSGNGRKLWRPWDGCARASWCLHLSFARNGLIRSNGKIYYITKNMTCVYVYIYMTWVSSIEIWECSHAGTCFFCWVSKVDNLDSHQKCLVNVWFIPKLWRIMEFPESSELLFRRRHWDGLVNQPAMTHCP